MPCWNNDEWVVVRPDLDRTQCVALLESHRVQKQLSKRETLVYVLAAINGLESDVFVWDRQQQRFEVPGPHVAIIGLNAAPSRHFFQRFCPVATMFREMSAFSERLQQQPIAAGSAALLAFVACLDHLLAEIRADTLEVHQRLRTPTLATLYSQLDSAQNGRLLFSIRNLHAVYLEATRPPVRAKQVWQACHSRLSVPDGRIRDLCYTLLEHSIRPLFAQVETLLQLGLGSITELATDPECLFRSRFRSDQQLNDHCHPLPNISKFWSDLLVVEYCEPLLPDTALQWITEAVRCSVALRLNGAWPPACRRPLNLAEAFRESMARLLARHAHPDHSNFQVLTEHWLETIPVPCPLGNTASRQQRRFHSYHVPAVMSRPLPELVSEALAETLEQVSRPVVQLMLAEFGIRYRRLFRFYANFFLLQKPDHLLMYMYFVFPDLKDYRPGELKHKLAAIHRTLYHADSDFGFFRLDFGTTTDLDQCEQLDWLLDDSFRAFRFLPSFGLPRSAPTGADVPFYEFWPLSQMFNAPMTELFNELLQFLIRLRYFQYLIGNDFFLLSRFRGLGKSVYLFRFRLANLVFQFGRQMEYRLQELVLKTEQRLEERCCSSMQHYFAAHQRLSERLEEMVHRTARSEFIRSQFRTIAKFCHANREPSTTLTESRRKQRKMAIWNNMHQLDAVCADHFHF